jgi:Asp-tRNA(Asn)/Glu-tRNA(Gln) amidotransferase C subunit
MSKIMTVDILSSIKGAKPSQAVNELFDVIKNANPTSSNLIQYKNAVSLDDLREDIVVKSAVIEREIIKENFPRKKDGYLVVAKIID